MAIEGHLGPITPREAEYVAAGIMRDHLGFKDAAVTTASGDGGVDVVAKQAVAQVKHWGSQVGRPALQQLYGARGADHSKKMVFFCSGGYSRQAIAYANDVGVALFTFDAAGSYEALNESAREIDLSAKKRAKRDAARAQAEVDHEAWQAARQVKQAARQARIESGDIPQYTWRTGLAAFFALLAVVFAFGGSGDDGMSWPEVFFGVATLLLLALVSVAVEGVRLERDRKYYEVKTGKRPPL